MDSTISSNSMRRQFHLINNRKKRRWLRLAMQSNNYKILYKKREDHKREEEGDAQEGRAGTIFFASGRPT